MNNDEYNKLVAQAKEARKMILTMIVSAHASHIGSAYSTVEILIYLYEKVLSITKNTVSDPSRDIFILSKGWAVSALYAVLAQKGIIDTEELSTYCKDGSKYIGIATRNGLPGIEATTGSMGHGLPIAVGYAIASKLLEKKNKIIVLMSDGELNEGSVWEAILQAGHHKLDNLTVIIDYNKWQSFGKVTHSASNGSPGAKIVIPGILRIKEISSSAK